MLSKLFSEKEGANNEHYFIAQKNWTGKRTINI
jgi:hypothetical protein